MGMLIMFVLFFYIYSMREITFIAAVLIVTVTSSSLGNYLLSNIESGSAYFTIKQKPQQITISFYEHTFTNSFSNTPSVAYTIQQIGLTGPVAMEWAVSTESIINSKLSIRFKHQPITWLILKAGFLVSARPDLLVGTIAANFDGLRQNIGSVFVNFAEPIPNHSTSIMRVFITGFSVKSGNQTFIRAFDKSINANRVELAVQVGGNMEITSAQLNYIIFSPRTSSFASYGGGQNEINLLQSKVYNIQKNIHYSPYKFYGIGNLRQSKNPLIVLTEIDDEFYLRVDGLKLVQQVYISYIVVGVTPSQVCSGSAFQSSLIYQKQCKNTCPPGSYLMAYSDGSKGCRKCPIEYNMVINQNKNGCECLNQMILRKGFCVNPTNTNNLMTNSMISQLTVRINQQIDNKNSLPMLQQSKPIIIMPKPIAQPIQPELYAHNTEQIDSNRIVKRAQGIQIRNQSLVSVSFNQIKQRIKAQGIIAMPNAIQAPKTTNPIIKTQINEIAPTPIPSLPTISGIPYIQSAHGGVVEVQQNIRRIVINNTHQPVTTNIQHSSVIPSVTIQNSGENVDPNRIIPNSLQSTDISINNNISPLVNRENIMDMQNSYVPAISNTNTNITILAPTISAGNTGNGNDDITNRIVQLDTSINSAESNSGSAVNGHQQAVPINAQSYIPSMIGSIPAPQPITPTLTPNTDSPYSSQLPPIVPPPPMLLPMAAPGPSPIILISSVPVPYLHTQQQQQQPAVDCSYISNSYWAGFACVCKVGFTRLGSHCVPIIQSIYKARPAQFIKQASALISTPTSVSPPLIVITPNTRPQMEANHPPKQQPNYHSMHTNKNTKPILSPPTANDACSHHAYRNATGHCMCQPGYILVNASCISNTTYCGMNSYLNAYGICQCIKGYQKYDGQQYCSLCPSNQIQIQVNGKCEHVCGVNQFPNITKGVCKCQCLPNQGIYNGVCQTCPSAHIIVAGYCVACPIRTVYDSIVKRCVCQAGYSLVNGVCHTVCTQANQYYCQVTKKCRCLAGLGRVNSKCVQCPSESINPITEMCNTQCQANQVRVGNGCICKPQYGYGPNKVCINCENIQGGFLLDGHCGKCPQNSKFVNGKCSCPYGMKLVQNRCTQVCSQGQLIDSNGFCYSCPINQRIDQNKCVCRKGYQRVNNACILKCPANTKQMNGGCGTCSMNTKYCPVKKQCVCQQGQYMSLNGYCQSYLPQMQCKQGTYFCSQSRTCKSCTLGCQICIDNAKCLKCQLEGFQPDARSGVCYPVCGDGIVSAVQECDDSNNIKGDGCFNCKIQQGWACSSTGCTKQNVQIQNIRPLLPQQFNRPQKKEQSSPPVRPASQNLKQVGEVIINQNNVFIVLQCPIAFNFASDSEMKSFIKYQFAEAGSSPTSAYCNQRASNRKIFECLTIYASGVPNHKFSINYSYSHAEMSGSTVISVNPFVTAFRSRSLK